MKPPPTLKSGPALPLAGLEGALAPMLDLVQGQIRALARSRGLHLDGLVMTGPRMMDPPGTAWRFQARVCGAGVDLRRVEFDTVRFGLADADEVLTSIARLRGCLP